MQTLLSSRYYFIRIMKSKDLIDLSDAIKAYVEFKKSRRDYSIKVYCDSVRRFDPVGVMEAAALQLT